MPTPNCSHINQKDFRNLNMCESLIKQKNSFDLIVGLFSFSALCFCLCVVTSFSDKNPSIKCKIGLGEKVRSISKLIFL